MYEKAFDDQKQRAMREYFLDELSPRGKLKKYKSKQTINNDQFKGSFGIVVSGKISKSVISPQGNEKLLYTMRPGEIFGEMDLLCEGDFNFLFRTKENAVVSYIARDLLLSEIANNTAVYSCLINSITRKFRIVLLQLTSNTFNDSTGRIADALIRLVACSDTLDVGHDPRMISTTFTQSELAHNVGCSRITVTRVLKQFENEKLISRKNRKIIIEDIDGLARYTSRAQ
ncbi:Crp/Fnr family transcriptional regulator [Pseudomonas sp. MBLB4136]|uniref:Crp/Fnr family transcriptional regulator n=1 Tax=Pseudomonas sp. MBLB4136 TaxID=3451558 RepID=UPI003F750620